MKILISVIVIILSHKIKMKTDEVLIRAFSETHEIFNDESHMILSHHSDEIKIDQNSVFSSVNIIIAEKTIFILNTVFQIIQLETANFLLISIKYL